MLGVLAVITLHVNSKYWYSLDINSFDWQVVNFYHGALTRWAVSVYVMISGALFLGRDVPLRRLYGKNILRIVTAFIFWSLIYSIAKYFELGSSKEALTHFISGVVLIHDNRIIYDSAAYEEDSRVKISHKIFSLAVINICVYLTGINRNFLVIHKFFRLFI